MDEDLYREIILDHYKHPSNFGYLPEANAKFRDSNTNCGDTIQMEVRVDGGEIRDIRFTGVGCAVCIASASLLTEKVKGAKISEVMSLGEKDVLSLLGLSSITPERGKCAMLPLKVLKASLIQFQKQA
ncbi:MAG: Fe-S cluster assembly sulfur transfer protein SufU [Thermoprotei archaeon]